MANKTILIRYLSGIADLTINVYPMAGGSVINPSPIAMTETATPGLYSGVMSTAVAGTLTTYTVNLLRGGVLIGQFLSDLVETVGTYNTFDGPTPLQISAQNPSTIYVVVTPTTDQEDDEAAIDLTCRRGDTYRRSFQDLGTLTGWATVYFTAKASQADDDDEAMVQVAINASAGDDGLLIFNGATAADETLASLEVENTTTGIVNLWLSAELVKQFPISEWYWDIEVVFSNEDVSTRASGTLTVSSDITRRTAVDA